MKEEYNISFYAVDAQGPMPVGDFEIQRCGPSAFCPIVAVSATAELHIGNDWQSQW